MKNLAGDKNCDVTIRNELKKVGLTALSVEKQKGEVESTVIAKLGPYTFRRAWSYWVVEGPVPLALAEELYQDPVAEDIRVAGHCGAPPPDKWARWFISDGREVLSRKQEKDFLDIMSKGDSFLKDIVKDYETKYIFSDDPKSIGAGGYVTTYHIDSLLGLRVFVDLMMASDQTDKKLPSWWKNP